MDKVFQQAKDKNVKSLIAYGDTADSKLYYDLTADTPVQIPQAEIEDAFKKGMLLIAVPGESATVYYKPYKLAANKVTTLDTVSTALTATEWAALAPSV